MCGLAQMDHKPELKAVARDCRTVADKIVDSRNRRSVLNAAAALDRVADECDEEFVGVPAEFSIAVSRPWQLKKRLQE